MDKKHATLTYTYTELRESIETPVELFSDVYDEKTSYLTNALWDTGAMTSVVSPAVVKKLNLDIVDTIEIVGINSNDLVDVAIVSIAFPNKALVKDLRVAVCETFPGTDMIIGMDVITQMDFVICNDNHQTLFSFAIPPFKDKIDFSNFPD
jgi:predicted aspartyl protease